MEEVLLIDRHGSFDQSQSSIHYDPHKKQTMQTGSKAGKKKKTIRQSPSSHYSNEHKNWGSDLVSKTDRANFLYATVIIGHILIQFTSFSQSNWSQGHNTSEPDLTSTLTRRIKTKAMADIQKTPFVRDLASSGMSLFPSCISIKRILSSARSENSRQGIRLAHSFPALQDRSLPHWPVEIMERSIFL